LLSLHLYKVGTASAGAAADFEARVILGYLDLEIA
jgi:hypothetical protein